ncbi:hypothetical protein K9L97_03655 [Candidatus Woesearchaeota archaeon]|nr:hypothetical protein [Candidatus Woesearchaeota archaeon]
MNKTNKILLGASIIIILCLLLIIITTSSLSNKIHSTNEIRANMIIGTDVGINLDSDKLYFGTLLPNGRAKRNMHIANAQDKYVYISWSGQKDGWLKTYGNPIQSSVNEFDIEMLAQPQNKYFKGEHEETTYITITNKKLSFLEELFLKGTLVSTNTMQEEKPKVAITINDSINTTQNDTDTE